MCILIVKYSQGNYLIYIISLRVSLLTSEICCALEYWNPCLSAINKGINQELTKQCLRKIMEPLHRLLSLPLMKTIRVITIDMEEISTIRNLAVSKSCSFSVRFLNSFHSWGMDECCWLWIFGPSAFTIWHETQSIGESK